MKYFVYISALCLVALAIVAQVASDSGRPDENPKQQSTTGSEMIDIPDIKNLPIYPGAEYVRKPGPADGEDRAETSYFTRAALQDVMSFYKDSLPTRGWRILGESNEVPEIQVVYFFWDGASTDLAHNIYLDVKLDELDRVDNRDAVMNVKLSSKFIPVPTRIPLYPQNRQEQITYTQGEYGLGTLTTTYLTDARPEDVKNYYMSSMPKYGWKRSIIESPSGLEGVSFRFFEQLPGDAVAFGEVTVTANRTGSTETQVQVKATGSMIRDELYQVNEE